MISKENKPDISFISTVPGLESIESCVPKPVSKYIPDWWKNMPTETNNINIENGPFFGNAKICPSFADYFSNGYIMPMWTDTIIYVDSSTGEWRWRTPNTLFEWGTHPNNQYLDYSQHKFFGKNSYAVLKMKCPWMVFSDQEYLMYQLPTYFHFNEDFSIVPGVRQIDKYNEMNIQFLIHSDKKEIFIERGTPIAHFIPFKKEKPLIDVRDATEKDFKKINKHNTNLKTKYFKFYKGV